MKLKDVCKDKKTGKLLFEVGILIMITNLLCAAGIWQAISNGWKVTGNGGVFFQAFIRSDGKYAITYLNQESIYISFLSVLFSFLGNKEELISIINLILQLTGISFFYFGAKKLLCFVFPLAVAVISGILSGCFYPVTADSSMHMIWFLSGLAFWMLNKAFCDISGLYRKHILLGILLGIFCYVDFAGIFFLVICIFLTFITKELHLKEKGIQLSLFILCGISSFLYMFYLWNHQLFDIAVYQYWIQDKMKYFSSGIGSSQYISIFVVLAVSAVFYTVTRVGNISSFLNGSDIVLQQIAEQEKQETEQLGEESTAEKQTAESSTLPEIEKPIKFLENPLPVPKKHVRKEMTYAFEPSKEQMHYDLNNYRLDDDYDLKD